MEGRGEAARRTTPRRGRGRRGIDWATVARVVLVPSMTGLPFTATTWVLNPTRCHLRTTQGKGRGVFGESFVVYSARSDHRLQLPKPSHLRP